MATALANLQTRRDNVASKLATLTSADDTPDQTGEASIAKVAKIHSLYRELVSLNRIITAMDTSGAAGVVETIGLV
jgi:hypothetical protein